MESEQQPPSITNKVFVHTYLFVQTHIFSCTLTNYFFFLANKIISISSFMTHNRSHKQLRLTSTVVYLPSGHRHRQPMWKYPCFSTNFVPTCDGRVFFFLSFAII